MTFRIFEKSVTRSTNEDARTGAPGDVFTAREQTAGRGRLGHRWQSEAGTNLLMSAVLDVADLEPAETATLPLVAGLAVQRTISSFLGIPIPPLESLDPPEPLKHLKPLKPLKPLPAPLARVMIKWPNDVWIDGRKCAGILCERIDDRVIVGIGVNVLETVFPPEIAERATSLALARKETGPIDPFLRDTGRPVVGPYHSNRTFGPPGGRPLPNLSNLSNLSNFSNLSSNLSVSAVRDAVLRCLGELYERWRERGFAAGIHPFFAAVDALRGTTVAIRQTDGDAEPIRGLCGGIRPDGTLDVGGISVPAGEAHVCLDERRSCAMG